MLCCFDAIWESWTLLTERFFRQTKPVKIHDNDTPASAFVLPCTLALCCRVSLPLIWRVYGYECFQVRCIDWLPGHCFKTKCPLFLISETEVDELHSQPLMNSPNSKSWHHNCVDSIRGCPDRWYSSPHYTWSSLFGKATCCMKSMHIRFGSTCCGFWPGSIPRLVARTLIVRLQNSYAHRHKRNGWGLRALIAIRYAQMFPRSNFNPAQNTVRPGTRSWPRLGSTQLLNSPSERRVSTTTHTSCTWADLPSNTSYQLHTCDVHSFQSKSSPITRMSLYCKLDQLDQLDRSTENFSTPPEDIYSTSIETFKYCQTWGTSLLYGL